MFLWSVFFIHVCERSPKCVQEHSLICAPLPVALSLHFLSPDIRPHIGVFALFSAGMLFEISLVKEFQSGCF